MLPERDSRIGSKVLVDRWSSLFSMALTGLDVLKHHLKHAEIVTSHRQAERVC